MMEDVNSLSAATGQLTLPRIIPLGLNRDENADFIDVFGRMQMPS